MAEARAKRAGSVKKRLKAKVGPTDKEPVIVEDGEDLEKRRTAMRRKLRAKRAARDLEAVTGDKSPGAEPRARRKRRGRKTVQERAVEAAEAAYNDGLPERNLDELADPHLRDLYRMRDEHKLMRDLAFKTVKNNAEGLNQRDAYTAIAVSRDYREIIAEIRAIEDQNQFATTVYDRVIVPLLSSVYQNFGDSLFALKQMLQHEFGENYARIEPRFAAIMTEHGRYMTQRRDETRGTLDSIFVVE